MSRSRAAKVIWKCPECDRTYRIPGSKPRPARCAKCARAVPSKATGTQAGVNDDDEICFQEAEPARSSALSFDVSVQRPSDEPVQSSRPDSSVSVDQLSDRLDEVLEHLEGITRTMRLVRWVMWGLGAATVVSIVVTLAGLMYSMSLVGSLSGLLNPSDPVLPDGAIPVDQLPAGDDRIPPKLRQDMQKIEEYSRTMEELLQEVNR